MLCFVLLAGLAGCGSDSALAQVTQTVEAVRSAGSFSANLKIVRTNPSDRNDNRTFDGFVDVEQPLTADMKAHVELPSYREWHTDYYGSPFGSGRNSLKTSARQIEPARYTAWLRNGELCFLHSRSRVAVAGLDPVPALRSLSLPADSLEEVRVSKTEDSVTVHFAVKRDSALHGQLNALCAALFGEALDSITAPSGALTLDVDGRPKSLTLEFTDLFASIKGSYDYTLTLDGFRYPVMRQVQFPADLDDYAAK